jgi:spore coat polysaccharide biosynthesis predicted glycosyltransferase SpsG
MIEDKNQGYHYAAKQLRFMLGSSYAWVHNIFVFANAKTGQML